MGIHNCGREGQVQEIKKSEVEAFSMCVRGGVRDFEADELFGVFVVMSFERHSRQNGQLTLNPKP